MADLGEKKSASQAALQGCDVSSQLVKQEEHAFLLPHVEPMRRLPKFGHRRTRGTAEPDSPSSGGADAFRLTGAGDVK